MSADDLELTPNGVVDRLLDRVEADEIQLRKMAGIRHGFAMKQRLGVMRDAIVIIERLKIGLKESVKIQSHYAQLLNCYDDGERMTFTSDEWLARLAAVLEKQT